MKAPFRRLLLFALPVFSFPAIADTAMVDGVEWSYSVSDGFATVTKADPATGSLSIPPVFGECPTKSVGNGAFSGCRGLTSVEIPDGVTDVGEYAFSGCSGLESVRIPDTVARIGEGAFDGCTDLSEVHVSDLASWCGISFDSYDSNPCSCAGRLFQDGEEIEDLVVPDDVDRIGNYAFYGCSGLTSVELPEDLTDIGDEAFSGCSGLTSISIPDGVTNIGTGAFGSCTGLSSITIPAGVADIGEEAFCDCSGLTSVEILGNVTTIGAYAFSGCSGLASITVPAGVTSIGEGAFSYCRELSSMDIPDSVTNIGSAAFFSCSGLTSIAVPDNVSNVGRSAFSGCSGLSSIAIPDSFAREVETWGLPAGCRIGFNVPDVVAAGVPVPKSWIFERARTALSDSDYDFSRAAGSVAANGEQKVWECYVAGLDPSASGDRFLALVRLDGDGRPEISWRPDLGADRDYVVEGKPSVPDEWKAPDGDSRLFRVRVAMPGFFGVASISFNSAGGSAVASITTNVGAKLVAPADPTRDGYSFACWNPPFPSRMPENGAALTARWTPNRYTIAFDTSGGSAIDPITADYGAAVMAPDDPTRAGFTFAGWRPSVPETMPLGGLRCVAAWTPNRYTITFDTSGGSVVDPITADYGAPVVAPDDPMRAGFTFAGWRPSVPETMPLDGLACVALWTPNLTWTSSGTYVTITGFEIDAVGDLVIPGELDGLPVRKIAQSAFSGCSKLTAITIPDSVTRIGEDAFRGCSGLTSITIGAGLSSLDNLPTGVEAFYASESSEVFACVDGVLFSKNLQTLIRFPEKKTGSYKIPDGVTSIGDIAFYGCSGLTSITIPDGVTSIGNNAFIGCSGLTSITISDSVTKIGTQAFNGCNGLEEVRITDLAAWCGISFEGDKSNPVQFSQHLFLDGEEVVDLVVPAGVTNVGDRAFYGCSGLKSVTFPDGVTSLGGDAFALCSGLTTLTIPAGLTNIGDDAFAGCSGLASIAVDAGNPVFDSRDNCNAVIRTVDDFLLVGCTNTVIPAGVTGIGDFAFMYCSEMTSVLIPDSVTSIGEGAFFGCSGLTEIPVPDGVTSIGAGAFYGCSGLTAISIPDGVTLIGNYTFMNCSGLTTLTIPDNVTSIGYEAFWGCWGLTSLSLPGRFEGHTSNMSIPDGCTVTFRN